MKKIALWADTRKIEVDDEDYFNLNSYKWYISDRRYVRAYMNGKWVGLGRYLLNTTELVDHKDRNYLNYQKNNLRVANKSLNAINSFRSDNTSGYRGVSWSEQNKKWMVQLTKNKNRMTIGFFEDKHEAARAYNEAVIKYFGEFAYINPIE